MLNCLSSQLRHSEITIINLLWWLCLRPWEHSSWGNGRGEICLTRGSLMSRDMHNLCFSACQPRKKRPCIVLQHFINHWQDFVSRTQPYVYFAEELSWKCGRNSLFVSGLQLPWTLSFLILGAQLQCTLVCRSSVFYSMYIFMYSRLHNIHSSCCLTNNQEFTCSEHSFSFSICACTCVPVHAFHVPMCMWNGRHNESSPGKGETFSRGVSCFKSTRTEGKCYTLSGSSLSHNRGGETWCVSLRDSIHSRHSACCSTTQEDKKEGLHSLFPFFHLCDQSGKARLHANSSWCV